MPYIPIVVVDSSNIEAIGYDRKTQTLRIIFHGGRAYDYPLVPEQEFQRLMLAESKGKFFASRIKPLYGYRTPRPEELQPPCEEPGQSEEVVTVPPALPRTPEGEVDYAAIPDASHLFEERDDLLDMPCRCCGKALRVPPEDACDLCSACYTSKGGDTDEQCAAHPGRLDFDPAPGLLIRSEIEQPIAIGANVPITDCPHGANGRDCEKGCSCACHYRPTGPHEHPQLESESDD